MFAKDLAGQERAFQVDIDNEIPFFFRVFQKSLGREVDARRVDQDVDSASRLFRLVQSVDNGLAFGNVDERPERLSAQRFQFRDAFLTARFGNVRNNYVRARLSERAAQRSAQLAGSADNHDRLTVVTKHVLDIF